VNLPMDFCGVGKCRKRAMELLMFVLLISLLVGCAFPPLSFEETIATELSYGEELQIVLDSALQATDGIGVSAAVVVSNEGTWVGVSGESYPGRPVTSDMLFDMGSAGKMLLGPLMVKLAEDGLLSLDDPLSKYLPDCSYADGSITIRQLLNHTNGLYMMVNHPNGPFRTPFAQIDHEKWWSIYEIFVTLGGEPVFAPGEGWCYTQAGYQLSTLIVEQITDSTVAEQIQTRLLDPLGIDGMRLDFSQPVPDHFEIAHPWVDVDRDGDYDDVNHLSRNWIASLSRILFYTRAKDFAIWGHALFTGQVLDRASMEEMLDFYHMDDWCGEAPIITGYGLGIQEIAPELSHGQPAWGHTGKIQGYRAYLAHLHQYGVTIVILANTDSDDVMPFIDGLIETVLRHLGEHSDGTRHIDIVPLAQLPEGVPVVQASSRQSLYCEHTGLYEVEASTEDWIDISLDWIVGKDEATAERVWDHHTHTISVNGQEIDDLADYTHGPEQYTVTCPGETLDIWSRGFSIYLPPLPEGEYEIVWFSHVDEKFDNGFVEYQVGDYLELATRLTVE
jgi:D-alanyl-D-alanine carboxypeptidase